MRFVIAGSGAMGSMFGGHLAAAGHDVTLADVDRAHLDAVAASGLRLRFVDGTEQVTHPGVCVLGDDPVPAADAVIVLCKTWANASVGSALTPIVGDGTWVLTFQNGIGTDDLLATALPRERILAGTTTAGAHKPEPGVVDVSAITSNRASISHLAPPRGGDWTPAATQPIVDALTAAGLPTEVGDDARTVMWTKVAMAATAGPITAVLRCTVQQMTEHSAAMAMFDAMFDEIVAVAAASGTHLDRDAVRAHAMRTYEAVGHHRTSMADDVLNGRRSEIDSFCGAIAAIGAQHGVATPYHAAVRDIVTAIEQVGGLR